MGKIGKKKIIIFAIIAAIIILFVIWTRIPIKYAVHEEDLNNYANSIIVQETWHTGTGWEQLGDSRGYFDDEQIEDVDLVGDIPFTASIGVDNVNTYLCQVEFLGYYDMQYKKYKVIEWYPIYPVKRNSILPSCLYPNGYISISDVYKGYLQ